MGRRREFFKRCGSCEGHGKYDPDAIPGWGSDDEENIPSGVLVPCDFCGGVGFKPATDDQILWAAARLFTDAMVRARSIGLGGPRWWTWSHRLGALLGSSYQTPDGAKHALARAYRLAVADQQPEPAGKGA